MVQPTTLQDHFVATRGEPAQIDGHIVHQIDRLNIGPSAVVTVTFQTHQPSGDNAAVLAVGGKGAIYLSDGSRASIVAIWEVPLLPRQVRHEIHTIDGYLSVYNKYRIHHRPDFVTEDSFTGNAGLVITNQRDLSRDYQCSRGDGPFSLQALAFCVEWVPHVNDRAT